MKTVKVLDVIEAAAKNGYPWIKNTMGSKSQGACIVGQAALNLDVDGWHLVDALNSLGDSTGGRIWVYNDDVAKSYDDALAYLKKLLVPHADKTIQIFEIFELENG